MMIERAVDGEEIVEINKILTKVNLVVNYLRLLGLLLFKDESLYRLLWIYNGLNH